jgi:hypothetical protein
MRKVRNLLDSGPIAIPCVPTIGSPCSIVAAISRFMFTNHTFTPLRVTWNHLWAGAKLFMVLLLAAGKKNKKPIHVSGMRHRPRRGPPLLKKNTNGAAETILALTSRRRRSRRLLPPPLGKEQQPAPAEQQAAAGWWWWWRGGRPPGAAERPAWWCWWCCFEGVSEVRSVAGGEDSSLRVAGEFEVVVLWWWWKKNCCGADGICFSREE